MSTEHTTSDVPILFRLNGVPVQVPAAYWGDLVVLGAGLVWLAGRRHPQRGWSERLLVGGLGLVLAVAADLTHVLGHTVTARLAGAPMDRVRVALGIPRTLYDDNAVPPGTHRMRAVGGPVGSLLGLLLSLLWRGATRPDSAARDLADASCLGHGVLFFGSLVPLPIFDAGTILKWTLVEQGRSEAEADALVHGVSELIGLGAVSTGIIVALRGHRLFGLALIAGGAVAIATGRDLIR
jgi:hypothetical protein